MPNLTPIAISFPHPSNPAYPALISSFWLFTHITTDGDTFKLGYITNSVSQALQDLPSHLSRLISVNTRSRSISLTADTQESRSDALDRILTYWRENKSFAVLAGWRRESYPIYAPPGILYAAVERAGAPLFGIVAHCAYLICYTVTGNKNEMRLWISRRSRTKQTYAGMLDVTAAGAVAVGEETRECVSREASEEASLPMEMVQEQAKEVAKVTYFGLSTGNPKHGGGEAGLCLPEAGVVYEMRLDESTRLKPRDGEVEEFYFWSVGEVVEGLRQGEFKGNSGAVMVDWLVRRGLLGLDKDVATQVSKRMRRALEFPHI